MAITTKEAAERWGISSRRVRTLCMQGKIPGAKQQGRIWLIPDDAAKPIDYRYKITKSLLEQIDEKMNLLSSKRPLTEGEIARLIEDFTVEYTYNSNAIEGNTLTLRETDMVLRGLTINKKPLQEHLEVIGHRDAFDFVCSLVKNQEKLTETIIKKIHYLVLTGKKEDRGVFRRIPVRILGAKHEPIQPYLIEPRLNQLLIAHNKNQEHIISRLARFHLEFEGIHPFIDGNGRTGRLIVNLELMKAGYPPIDIKFTNRLEYYNAFDEYYDKHNIKAMENLLASYVLENLTKYLAILDAKEKLNNPSR